MKIIKVPQILGYTKVVKKKISLKVTKDVKIPTNGLTWEQRILREQEDRERREQKIIAYLMADRAASKVREKVAKARKVKHEFQVGCVRDKFTFYKTLVWYT
jgi:hypothetical protein